MNPCSWSRKRLVDRIEGGLNDREARIFDAHIKECPVCRKEYETTRRLYSRLRDDVMFPDDTYWDSLPQRIRARDVPLRARSSRFRKLVFAVVPIIAACMVAVLLSRRPCLTIEMTVPISELLEDKDIAAFILTAVVHGDVLEDFTIIEESLPFDIDEIVGGMTAEEQRLFIDLMKGKYGNSI